MVLRYGDTYFAYGSSTGWEKDGSVFPILRSEDLRHWRFVGNALKDGPAWSTGDLWSPSVLRWHGHYLLYYNAERSYYTAQHKQVNEHCLTVAESAHPWGPFTTVNMLVCRSGMWQGFIDPAPLVAPKKALYLYFSVDFPVHSIRALRLSADGLHALGRPRFLLSFSPYWRSLNSDTVEGPWSLHRHGFYYLFYSTGSWNSDYRMSYAVSRKPLGPFSDSAPVPILKGRAKLRGPGGGSVFTGPGGRTWLAFAAWSGTPGYGHGSWRTLRVAPLRWSKRGLPKVILKGS
jgi:beta-xylosidase